MAPDGPVTVQVDGGVAVVTLDEPDRRNPLSPSMVAGLTAALHRLAPDDDCSVVVITGAGKGFCAGADLGRMAVTSVREDREEYDAIIELNHLVWTYPKPTIAAVHGFALGGGCSLMNWCDFAFVEEGTRLGFPEVVGGLPSTTVIPTLLRLVGRRATLDLVLRGRGVDPARAEQIGLITRAVPAGEALASARELAVVLAAYDSAAIRVTKQILATVEDLPYREGVAYGKEMRVLYRAMVESDRARATGASDS
jgi:methylglutaconyl-CoA hydratase